MSGGGGGPAAVAGHRNNGDERVGKWWSTTGKFSLGDGDGWP